ncbi:MAG: hypothetical protein ACLQUY_01410 [Ktedonobacterales bacterium]
MEKQHWELTDDQWERLDLSGVQPAARWVVHAAARIYAHHTEPWLIGLLVHGSACKGDFIPGCSDIDLKLYLRDEAFVGPDTGNILPFALAAAIHRDLAQVDPTPFQYIQCYAERSVPREGQLGPVAGAYHMVLGSLPVPEATSAQLLAAARTALERLDPYPDYIAKDLLQHGGSRFERVIRFACTDVWPVLYQVLCLQQPDPVQVWTLPKRQAIALLPPGSLLQSTIAGFHASVTAYYTSARSVERGLQVLQDAVAFFAAARTWWDMQGNLH